jgi:hypothetical protein
MLGDMKNFHLPLPNDTYEHLRAAAERSKVRHDAIAAYAAETAGTDLDLDAQLEVAGIEHLIKTGRGSK